MSAAPLSRRASSAGGSWRGALLPAAVGLAALAARSLDLGRLPLDPPEAAAALAAWTGLPAATAPLHHGALVVLGRAAEALAGADAAARLPSALAGALAAALCLSLRRPWGLPGAAASAVLLAAAPWWVDAGRHVDPAPLGLAVVVGAAVALRSGRVALASALAGAGLAAGLLAQSALAGAALAAAAWLVADRRAGQPPWIRALWPTRAHAARSAASVAAGFVLAVAPAVAGASGRAPLAVLSPFVSSGSLLGLPAGGSDPVALLLVYAPLVTVFGIAGIAGGLAHRRRIVSWLAAWLLVAAIAAPWADAPAAASALLAPLTLAAGGALAGMAAALRQHGAWAREGAIGAIVSCCLVYALLRYGLFAERGVAGSVDPVDSLALARYGLMVAVLPLVVAALMWGRLVALRSLAGTGAVALLALGAANGSALLGGRHLELARPLRAELGVRFLAAEARGREGPIRIDPAVGDAAAWALHAAGVAAVPDDTALEGGAARWRVVPADEAAPGAWRTVTRWRPHFADDQAFARWYLQRRTAAPGPSGTLEGSWARLDERAP